jgi:hypothetical protein
MKFFQFVIPKISKERCRLLPLVLQNLEGLVLLLFEKKIVFAFLLKSDL